ncbi:hypothetical protein [Flammeovirga sp. SJP92]|uniref:hypothetical protein n=1 Tax=Flammeovirga sp. SJP92 TaxID=1775430 RepID=UPI0007893BAC|nr:hypothetical protein [Flammeovirga sp. SJP92]KXX68510.1 hypothetical protein AVL50_22355 [Flammeovirga sp. SJP92]
MKVAIIEIGGSHSECIYSQVLFLQNLDAKITLILDPKVEKLIDYDHLYEHKEVIDTDKYHDILMAFKIRSYILKEKFDTVIFNTAQGNFVKYLCLLPFPSNVNFTGTLHNLQKCNGSIGYKIIAKKCKKLFALSDYLIEELSTDKNKFTAYYPKFFPKFETNPSIKKSDANEIWITIPGGIFFERKPYLRFINALKNVPSNVKFIFLGKGNEEHYKKLLEEVKRLDLQKNIELKNSFMSNEDFHTYIQLSDFILPLVDTSFSNDMYKTRITGAFNLAYAYEKVMIMDHSFNKYQEFKDNTIFYSMDKINEIIENLSLDHSYIPQKRLSLGTQSQRYNQYL